MAEAWVSLDSIIEVVDAENLTTEEIIHNASEQIVLQLQIDHDAFEWSIEWITEMGEG